MPTKCSVEHVAPHNRAIFPVFGGISGSMSTMLNDGFSAITTTSFKVWVQERYPGGGLDSYEHIANVWNLGKNLIGAFRCNVVVWRNMFVYGPVVECFKWIDLFP